MNINELIDIDRPGDEKMSQFIELVNKKNELKKKLELIEILEQKNENLFQFCWRTKEGLVLNIFEMEESHIKNILEGDFHISPEKEMMFQLILAGKYNDGENLLLSNF